MKGRMRRNPAATVCLCSASAVHVIWGKCGKTPTRQQLSWKTLLWGSLSAFPERNEPCGGGCRAESWIPDWDDVLRVQPGRSTSCCWNRFVYGGGGGSEMENVCFVKWEVIRHTEKLLRDNPGDTLPQTQTHRESISAAVTWGNFHITNTRWRGKKLIKRLCLYAALNWR